MIAAIIYCLCALTSLLCALLLLRAYVASRNRFLFWSGAAFCAFGLSNVALVIDLSILPEVDLSLIRNCITLSGLALLIWGLIWKSSS